MTKEELRDRFYIETGILEPFERLEEYMSWLEKNVIELSKLHQPTVISSVCDKCRFNDAKTYHDKMWCRDCQQKNHFEQTAL